MTSARDDTNLVNFHDPESVVKTAIKDAYHGIPKPEHHRVGDNYIRPPDISTSCHHFKSLTW